MLNDTPIELLPSSKHFLSPISQEKTLAFSVPTSMTEDFITAIRELPATSGVSADSRAHGDGSAEPEEKRWMMSAVKAEAAGVSRTWRRRWSDGWTAFVDQLKVSRFYTIPSERNLK